MQRALLVLSLAACVVYPARARLGETEAQTIARYGPAGGAYNAGSSSYTYRTLTFDHEGYTIITQFIGPTCEMICFQKPDGSALTEDDLDLLLKTQSGGQAWSRSDLVSIDLLWDRPDGAMARYDTEKHLLAFCSARYIEATDARRHAAEKQKEDSL